jgi:alkylated DNA repair dioxygenase AlkB
MRSASRIVRLPDEADLFGESPAAAIEGLKYERDFLTRAEEEELLRTVRGFELREMRYKAYTARRRLRPGPPMPESLHPLRARVAAWMGMAPEDFPHALLAEYRPGTPLGWHRDVPDFEDIVGVSLLGDAVLQLRPYPPASASAPASLQLRIAPRSIYMLRGPARWAWQHAIAPTEGLRYSITMRTRRRG